MSVEYCAYPFLKEKNHLCDHEIATNRLASVLSVARHHIRHIPREDPLQLMEMIYRANGSTRGAHAIGEAELKKLSTFYTRYHTGMDHLVPPDGCIGTSHLHMPHVEVKAAIRTMHQIQCEGKLAEAVLLDLMNLLSNTSFMMCLYESAQDGIREKEFISRSYI